MKRIDVGNGNDAKVDDSEYGHLVKFHWFTNSMGYVVRRDRLKKSSRTYYMHRQIMGDPDKLVVDHINADKLDNRIKNLRVCHQRNNSYNRTGWKHRKTHSQWKGVSRDIRQKTKPWCAKIMYERKTYNLGYFETELEAAKAYNEAARKYHGEFALLNDVN